MSTPHDPTSPAPPSGENTRESQQEQALQVCEARFQTLFDYAQVGIVLADAQSFYLDANPSACRMFGYTRDEFIGLHASDIIAQAEVPQIGSALAEIASESHHHREWHFRRKDGTVFPADVLATRMPDETLLGIIRDISDRKRAEALGQVEQMVQSEKLFSEMLIESTPGVLYFYDVDGHFLRWNQNFETVTGYSGEEIERMHPRDFFSNEERPRLEHRIAEVFANGESSLEASLVAKNGTATPYFFTGRRVLFEGKPCLVGLGIDISDRKHAEDRLAESEQKYRELVEQSNSIIVRWKSDGRITFLNEYGQRFFGFTADEIIGLHVIGTIVPPNESGGRDLSHLMDVIRADPAAFEQNINENIRRNGERVWVSWSNRIVRDSQGQVVEFLSIGSDITDRIRVEAEREKRERAETADRIKSAFLATMSHELRTPLNSIIGFTGIILQGLAGPLNEEQTKQLGMVRTSARHLLALVNDVLDISKIEAGQLEIACESFDLCRSINKVVALVAPQAEAKQLKLNVMLNADLGQAVSDQRRFEQIVLNLLSNAVKFTEHGEITLFADLIADFKMPEAVIREPAVRVRVSDTRIGIKAEDLKTLFQHFRQIDSGLSRNHEGTGLGLAICRRLATLMGGEINAESEWGKGSTFTVTLPLQGPKVS